MLVACAPSTPNEPASTAGGDTSIETFNEIGGAVDEYNAATTVYLLPDGYTYPDAPFTDSSGSYQVGYGTSAAVTFWNCAWGKAYLAAQGTDPVAADAALEQFAAITETETYKLYYDPASAYPLFESAIANAQLGDPTTLQSIVTGSCTS